MPDTILSLGSAPLLSPGIQPGGKKDSPEEIHKAAQQFESLLISQILKTARDDSDEGWLGTGDDQTASSAMGIAEEQLAQSLSTKGGLGLSRLIEQGLTKSTNATE